MDDLDKKRMLVVLGLAAVLGFVYLILMPPWQHYDEPMHFEYAWWIAEKGRPPNPDDRDYQMRFVLADSMIRYHFYDNLGFLPNLNNKESLDALGLSQLTNPPLYYLLAALPMKLFPPLWVTHQLYAARLFSYFLYLLSIAAAWGIMTEITPPGHLLRFLLPLTLACWPGYLDIMTAINNDVGAIMLAFFCLWGCVRLVLRGLTWLNLGWVLFTSILIFLTKETAYFMFGVAIVALWLSFWNPGKRWIAWLVVAAAGVAAIWLVLFWDDAAYWYRSTSQSASTRVLTPLATQGKAAFQIDTTAPDTPAWMPALFQPISRQPFVSSQDRTYTLGAWVWAEKPMQVASPLLAAGKTVYKTPVSASQEPVFVAFTVVLPAKEWRNLRVILQPSRMGTDSGGKVYYDGIVVVEGTRPLDQPPIFRDAQGRTGTWGGQSFTNLLRNGSAESAGPRWAARLDSLGARFLPDNNRLSLLTTSLYDWSGAKTYYFASASRLFRTAWGYFGWGQVPLSGHRPYRFLLAASLIGLAVTVVWAVAWLFKRQGKTPWDLIGLFILVLAGGWGVTLIRGIGYLGLEKLYLPVARNGFPALIPVLLGLTAGWSAVGEGWVENRPIARWLQVILPVLFLTGLQIWSILSIFNYYYQ